MLILLKNYFMHPHRKLSILHHVSQYFLFYGHLPTPLLACFHIFISEHLSHRQWVVAVLSMRSVWNAGIISIHKGLFTQSNDTVVLAVLFSNESNLLCIVCYVLRNENLVKCVPFFDGLPKSCSWCHASLGLFTNI